MKNSLVTSFLFAVTFICFPVLTAYGDSTTITMQIAYDKEADVPSTVRAECALETKLSDFIKSYAESNGVSVTSEKGDNANAAGRVLDVRITHALARGGGAWSGPKSVAVRGELREGGKVVGSFRARRTSGGGAFGGFKGTCGILDRCAKTLGKDIAQWLKSPAMDSHLGEN